MPSIEKILTDAIRQLNAGRLGDALRLLRPLYEGHPQRTGAADVLSVAEDYGLMLQYMRQGFADPGREKLYNKLLRLAYKSAADLLMSWRCKNVSVYVEAFRRGDRLNMSHDFLKQVLESFVSDEALLSLEPPERQRSRSQELYARHTAFMDRLFNQLFVSCQWSSEDASFYASLLLSPTLSMSDALFMVSAISLNAMNIFDIRKSETLMNVYLGAQDAKLRERALVGWVLSLRDDFALFAEQKEQVSRVCADPERCKELLGLQQQYFFCMNVDKDSQTIKDDIMPGLMRNQTLRFNRFGVIEEREDDELEDVLHPDAQDKATEEVEKHVERMADMQRKGSDIFFGGFSQMKRFPFFDAMANWLLPFTLNHPDLTTVREKIEKLRLTTLVQAQGSFCDSDLYSFSFAVGHIIDRLPKNVIEALSAQSGMALRPSDAEMSSPAFVRRLYLQDLLRFFRLFRWREQLVNPFSTGNSDRLTAGDATGVRGFFMADSLFCQPQLHDQRVQMCSFLFKQGRWSALQALLSTFDDADVSVLPYRARYALKSGRLADAVASYRRYVQLRPDSKAALGGLAKALMLTGNYAEAEKRYDALSMMTPDSIVYDLDRCMCLLRLNRHDEALQLAYKLDYEHPDNKNVLRLLAWSLLCTEKVERATTIYQRLMADEPNAEDCLNAGYCLWVGGQMAQAIDAFKAYCARKSGKKSAQALQEAFQADQALLEKYGKVKVERLLMIELVTVP